MDHDAESQTTDTVERLADALATRLRAPIPIGVALWSAKDAADYLRICERQFRERIAVHPEFPTPVRLPIIDGRKNRKGHPRRKAREVIAWAERQR